MKYFIVTFQISSSETKSMFVSILKSMNFSYEIMDNVWITAGIGKTADATSIFEYLNRFITNGDVVMVSQIATPASTNTLKANTCQNGIREIIYT